MPIQQRAESNFLPSLFSGFLAVLSGIPADAEGEGTINKNDLLYCERFVEFLTDLLSQVNRGVPHYMTPPTLVVYASVVCAVFTVTSMAPLAFPLSSPCFPSVASHTALCARCARGQSHPHQVLHLNIISAAKGAALCAAGGPAELLYELPHQ